MDRPRAQWIVSNWRYLKHCDIVEIGLRVPLGKDGLANDEQTSSFILADTDNLTVNKFGTATSGLLTTNSH